MHVLRFFTPPPGVLRAAHDLNRCKKLNSGVLEKRREKEEKRRDGGVRRRVQKRRLYRKCGVRIGKDKCAAGKKKSGGSPSAAAKARRRAKYACIFRAFLILYI